jgi:superfamily II DNA or RNA helicase
MTVIKVKTPIKKSESDYSSSESDNSSSESDNGSNSEFDDNSNSESEEEEENDILCKKGYRISKSTLKDNELDDLKTQLIVTPKKLFNIGADNNVKNSFGVYVENKKYIFVPKYFAMDELGKKMNNANVEAGTKIDIKSTIELRDYQIPIVDLIQKTFRRKGGGILSLPCGRGKTIIAIDNIVKTGLKTLVIVHKAFLMNQWKRQIEKLTNARVGIIQRKKVQVENKDIVIAMLKSLSMCDYDPEIFKGFGLVIVDECHHIAAEVYSRALPRVSCKYTLGLSATPERADGLSKIFHWYLGPIIYQEKIKVVDNVKAKIFKFKTNDPRFKQINHWKTKEPMAETMISNLIEIDERNKLFTLLINERRRRGTFSKILVLSRRRVHLETMKKLIDKSIEKDKIIYKNLCSVYKILLMEKDRKNDEKTTKQVNAEIMNLEKLIEKYEYSSSHVTDYYVGGMKEEKLSEAEEADIIFGTFDMAQEALDIPNLNTVYFTTPRSDVIQATGRILRCTNYDISPEIYDVVDQLKTFINKGKKREIYYKSAGYNLFYYNINLQYENDKLKDYDISLTSYMSSEDALKMSKRKDDKPNVIDLDGLVSDAEYD